MGDDISVLNDRVYIFTGFAIDRDLSCLNGMLVVFSGAITEFCCENVKDFSTAPSLFAEGVVGVVVRRNSAQTLR
ncbi:hypothetical protein GJ744_006718 [Endocarpon pusillum]|uniref:Uncharacterized protein n=1 Tax=Endocarpon pusillum TaxID=364733 RepID=A0A8H7AN43_9EURO|nr:hypothetical protein GJ744_006718 [Endocarpon pusillum]